MGEDITIADLQRRPHSWRGYEPQEFVDVAVADGKVNARKELRTLESGRFEPMLKAGHKFFSMLDRDEMEEFADRNQDLVNWVSVWGFLEDLRYFEPYHELDYPDY